MLLASCNKSRNQKKIEFKCFSSLYNKHTCVRWRAPKSESNLFFVVRFYFFLIFKFMHRAMHSRAPHKKSSNEIQLLQSRPPMHGNFIFGKLSILSAPAHKKKSSILSVITFDRKNIINLSNNHTARLRRAQHV